MNSINYMLFSIYDKASGIYGNPFVAYNVQCAKREFIAYCRTATNNYLADDLQLYCLGEFNPKTGELISQEGDNFKPVFIMNGVSINE